MENLIARRGMNFEDAANVARKRREWKKAREVGRYSLRHAAGHKMQLRPTYIFLMNGFIFTDEWYCTIQLWILVDDKVLQKNIKNNSQLSTAIEPPRTAKA